MRTTKKDKKLSLETMKSSISDSKVIKSAAKKQEVDLADDLKIKRLMFKQKSEGTLTVDERSLVEAHVRQTNEEQVRYQNQRRQAKSQGIEI